MKKPRLNNQITAPELRVIEEDGSNLGVLPLNEAIKAAEERGKDLIEVASKANPPVARIMDFGKYQYKKEKEARAAKKKSKEIGIKGIRARLGTSPHDLAMKVKKVEEFLKGGDHVRVEFILRGREKGLKREFVLERLNKMLETIPVSHEIIDGPKKGPRGYIVTIAGNHAKNKQGSKKTDKIDEKGENSEKTSSSKPL